MNQLQQFLAWVRNVSLCNNICLEVKIILTASKSCATFNSGANHDLVLRTPPLTFRLGMGLSQSETQTKRFATLSVVRIIILIELHFESNLIRLLKHIETMKLKLSQIQMRDPICNTLEKTKI